MNTIPRHPRRTPRPSGWGILTMLLLWLAGCGGGDDGAAASGEAGRAALIATSPESTGSRCAHGGTRVDTGPDANGDGTLDASEVTRTAYVCNPPPAGLAWVTIAADDLAQPNTGYVVTGDAEVALTLPDDPPVNSVLRIHGQGRGGWRVEQQDGQFIHTMALPGGKRRAGPWQRHATSQRILASTMSADGRHLALVGEASVMTSDDHGATWTERMPISNASGIVSSADGRHLVVVGTGQRIHVSNDYGATWSERGEVGNWISVASSASGGLLVAAADQMYESRDFGATWNVLPGGGVRASRLAMSATGQYMLATEFFFRARVSSDFGATWTLVGGFQESYGAAVSADGSVMLVGDAQGSLRFSTDHGRTWTPIGSVTHVFAVAMSADGRTMVAGKLNDSLHVSDDQGVTWTVHDEYRGWLDASCSADCGRMVAVAFGIGGNAFALSPTTTYPGARATLGGGQGSTVELHYVGGGAWTLVGYSGDVATR